jgi:rhomboid protease GluP
MEHSQIWRRATAPARRSGAFYVPRYGAALFMRLFLWAVFGGLAALLLVALRGNAASLWMVAVLLGILALFEWGWGRHAPLIKPLLTVDAGGIGSTVFPRKRRHLRWREIASVTVRNVHGMGETLFVEPVDPKPRRSKARRAFQVRLAMLRKSDRELVQALVAHHARTAGIAPSAEVIAERAFAAQMQALPRTWGLYCLIATNVCVWLVMLWRGAAINGTSVPMLVAWGGNVAVLVQDGQWWRLLTATFVHGSVKHLFFNMVVLYALGAHVERFFGTRSFLLIYFGAGLLGSALSLHFAAHSAVSVGASGAVFGVGGALLVAVLRYRHQLPQTIHKKLFSDAAIMIGYSLVQGFLSTRVDNAAHVGGLVGGALLAWCLPVKLAPETYREKLRRGTMLAAVVGTVAVVGVAALAPPAPQAMRDGLARDRQFELAAVRFKTVFQGLQADAAAVKSGKMTEREADERSRAVHAPAVELALSELLRVTLPPGDPRAPMLHDMTLFADALHEYLRMDSVWDASTHQYVPADAARGKALNADMERLMKRINARVAEKRKG